MSTHSLRVKWTVKLKTIRGFPNGTSGKEPTCNAGDVRDVGSIPGSERFPKAGHGNPLQYSCLENPMDRGAWHVTVRGVTKSQTRLTDALSPGCCGGCHTGVTARLQGRIRHSFSGGVFAAVQLWHMDRRNTPAGQICHGLEAPDLVAAKYFLKQLNVSTVSKRKSSYKSHHTQGDPWLHV